MMQQQASAQVSTVHKKELLHAIYNVYSRWVERFPLACRKGCAACCTVSVTMTSLEGEDILDFVKRKGRGKWLQEKLAGAKPGKSKAAITVNQFAEACLKHQEVDSGTLGSWDFTPCVFLEDNGCSIYEVRPFGCRSFVSFVQCATDRAAEIAPIHLTVSTVFTQIIEHVSSDGGYWSTMADILHSLTGCETRGEIHLVPARPVPGFLLENQELQVVHALLQQLSGHFSEKGIFGDLIDNFMPI
jgi:Fe-S-cluster containining protein